MTDPKTEPEQVTDTEVRYRRLSVSRTTDRGAGSVVPPAVTEADLVREIKAYAASVAGQTDRLAVRWICRVDADLILDSESDPEQVKA